MNWFVKSTRKRFVIGSLHIFPDLTLCVFAECGVSQQCFVKGESAIFLQRNDGFDHVSFLRACDGF